jgi:hypothetical protein
MTAVSRADAIERVAKTIEQADDDDLVEFYAELFPSKARPDAKAAGFPARLAEIVRAGIEPELLVDLWNIAFPTEGYARYDEEDETLRYNEMGPRYAEPAQ